jgi:hypothetical protein
VTPGALLLVWLLAEPAPSTSPAAPAPLPSLPGLPAPLPGVPAWLTIVGYILAVLGTLGIGGVLVKLLERRKDRAAAQRTEAEADEVFSRVAITLIEPLRDRLDRTEQRLTDAIKHHEDDRAEWERQRKAERLAFDAELAELRAKVREALTEADGAAAEAHRLRRLVQQWHRAIMDPAATIDWLRQLVGPDEPAI